MNEPRKANTDSVDVSAGLASRSLPRNRRSRRVLHVVVILLSPIAGYYAKGYRRRALCWAISSIVIFNLLLGLALAVPQLAALLVAAEALAGTLFLVLLVDALRLPVVTGALPSWRKVVLALILVVGLPLGEALAVRTCCYQAFTMPSGSMMDTLLIGDYMLVNKLLYRDLHLPGLRPVARGDIVVFKYPMDESRDFIKRIIAVGGDIVQVRDNRVWLNGTILDEPYVRPGSFHAQPSSQCGYLYACEPLKVPPGSYFVMGDNRDNSQDSRYWGFIKREKIHGKLYVIYWSWNSERGGVRWSRLGREF